MYWTNHNIDPDQKTPIVHGQDTHKKYNTPTKNNKVKDKVAAARLELDPVKREALYVDIQKMAKDDVHWIDLYYSPYINVSRKNIENFYQNPLGRFFLEDTVKN
jgi:peptide/nickel transport system substrate-binding protein